MPSKPDKENDNGKGHKTDFDLKAHANQIWFGCAMLNFVAFVVILIDSPPSWGKTFQLICFAVASAGFLIMAVVGKPA